MTAPTVRPLPSYARDAEHAAEIAAHITRLVDDAPPFDPAQARRLRHLLRPEPVPLSTSNAA
jgi:hypothetical protein